MKSLTLKLGSTRTWRGYQSGKCDRTFVNGKINSKHLLAEYKDVRVPDSIADGLVSEAEEWSKHRRLRDDQGCLERLFEVSDLKEIGPDPDTTSVMIGGGALISTLQVAITEAVKAAVKELLPLIKAAK